MSTFKVEIVKLGPIKEHPNADSLELTEVWGYPVVVLKNKHHEGDLVAYIPIDSVVDISKPEFKFLDPKKEYTEYTPQRIKAKRLRSVFSMGMVEFVPEYVLQKIKENNLVLEEGLDVAEFWNIKKYENPTAKLKNINHKVRSGLANCDAFEDGPSLRHYDLENYLKFKESLNKATEDGTNVVVTTKMDGCNGSAFWDDDRFWVKSHKRYRKKFEQPPEELVTKIEELKENYENLTEEDKKYLNKQNRAHNPNLLNGVWWEAAVKYNLEFLLSNFKNYALCFEIYGDVQSLNYGHKSGEISIVVFDVLNTKTNTYLDYEEMCDFVDQLNMLIYDSKLGFNGELLENDNLNKLALIDTANVEYLGPNLTQEEYHKLANTRDPRYPDQIKEGVVIKTVKEKIDNHYTRMALKFVSEEYLLSKHDNGDH